MVRDKKESPGANISRLCAPKRDSDPADNLVAIVLHAETRSEDAESLEIDCEQVENDAKPSANDEHAIKGRMGASDTETTHLSSHTCVTHARHNRL